MIPYSLPAFCLKFNEFGLLFDTLMRAGKAHRHDNNHLAIRQSFKDNANPVGRDRSTLAVKSDETEKVRYSDFQPVGAE